MRFLLTIPNAALEELIESKTDTKGYPELTIYSRHNIQNAIQETLAEKFAIVKDEEVIVQLVDFP
jgi:hypothetical protein